MLQQSRDLSFKLSFGGRSSQWQSEFSMVVGILNGGLLIPFRQRLSVQAVYWNFESPLRIQVGYKL